MKPALTMALVTSAAALFYCQSASAGKRFPVTRATPKEAMDAATKKVEEEAKKKGTCVSKYPDLKECIQLPDGQWQCTGVRANHKKSCK